MGGTAVSIFASPLKTDHQYTKAHPKNLYDLICLGPDPQNPVSSKSETKFVLLVDIENTLEGVLFYAQSNIDEATIKL